MSTYTPSFSKRDLIEMFGDAARHLPENLNAIGVSTNTRTISIDNVFIALKGENFDGHQHVNSAVEKGVSVVVTEKDLGIENQIIVSSTLNALGTFGWFHRRRFAIPVIAVAGASGKTSTKDLLAHVLSVANKVHKTQANHNNQIGTPHTLLGLTPDHEGAVIEIGTNEPGEIESLCAMVQPTHGVITTIGEEHLEKLIDLDGVEKEETALFDYLNDHGGLAFVNVDDERLRKYGHNGSLAGKTVTFGLDHPADIRPTISFDSELRPAIHLVKDDVTFRAQLQSVGYAAALNAVAVAAIAWALNQGAEIIKQGLSSYEPAVAGSGYARMAVQQGKDHVLLNDTYNANPQSMTVSLKTLGLVSSKKRIAVLGDMLELGPTATVKHDEILSVAIENADLVIVHGPEFSASAQRLNNATVIACDTHAACIDAVQQATTSGTIVLVKGSRGLQMERVVQGLL